MAESNDRFKMAESNDSDDPLFEILLAISNIDLGYDNDRTYDDDGEAIARGLHSSDSLGRRNVYLHICEKQRKRNLTSKLNELKVSILQKNRKDGVNALASLMDDLLEPSEKQLFINQFAEKVKGETKPPHVSDGIMLDPENPEYIPIILDRDLMMTNQRSLNETRVTFSPLDQHYQQFVHDNQTEDLFSQSTDFSNMEGLVDFPNGLQSYVNSDDRNQTIKLPIETQYNSSEIYLINKGIQYSRSRLKLSITEKENTIINELKLNRVLQVILSEEIYNEKSYMRDLVDNYPISFGEIKFLVQKEKEIILKSPIFVYMAQKSLANLIDLLKRLKNIVDRTTLSRACQQSAVDGVTLVSILMQDHTPEINSHANNIVRFIDRFRQGPTYDNQ